MAKPYDIVVVTGPKDPFKQSLLSILADMWLGDDGLRVRVHRGSRGPLPPAPVGFLHVDRTKVPSAYRELTAEVPRVANGGVDDISKSSFSELRLSRADAWDGRVIVKTEANFGGLPEWMKDFPGRRMAGRPHTDADWATIRTMPEYVIFDHLDAVPDGVWSNEHLLVERYQREQTDDGLTVLRIWIFLGDCEIHYQVHAHGEMVKGRGAVARIPMPTDEVPDELRALRASKKFDYGKFDYALVDGAPVVYDVNKTPNAARSAIEDVAVLERLRGLAKGIHALRNEVQ